MVNINYILLLNMMSWIIGKTLVEYSVTGGTINDKYGYGTKICI